MNSNALIHTLTLAAAAKLIMAQFPSDHQPVVAMPDGIGMDYETFATRHAHEMYTGTPGFLVGLKHPDAPEWLYVQVSEHPRLSEMTEVGPADSMVGCSTSISNSGATVGFVAVMIKAQFDSMVKQGV